MRWRAISLASAAVACGLSASGRHSGLVDGLSSRSNETVPRLVPVTSTCRVCGLACQESVPATSITTTLRYPSSAMRCSAGRETPSRTITTNGSLAVIGLSGSNEGRPVNSLPPRSCSRSLMLSVTMRRVPLASREAGSWLCGNHFTQSQWSRASSLTHSATRASPGPCAVASCPSMARTSPRTSCGAPWSCNRANPRR